jgi:hypothetical protein
MVRQRNARRANVDDLARKRESEGSTEMIALAVCVPEKRIHDSSDCVVDRIAMASETRTSTPRARSGRNWLMERKSLRSDALVSWHQGLLKGLKGFKRAEEDFSLGVSKCRGG